MFSFLNKFIGGARKKAAPEAVLQAGAASPAPAQAGEEEAPQTEADLARLDVLQLMWGKGFSGPGDADFITGLAHPLNLNAQKLVLGLSAGLGGGVRALADTFKTFVTGLERDDELAFHGNKLSLQLGHERTASIAHYNPAQIQYPKQVDAVFARDILYTMKDKDVFAVRLSALLKPTGQVILTDFTCGSDIAGHPAVAAWMAGERYGAYPISDTEMAALLTRHMFAVRESEDITRDYVAMIMDGLARLAAALEGKKISAGTKEVVRAEFDLWTRRLAALGQGVKYTRIYAVKE